MPIFMKERKKFSAFTLIELMIAVVIIGILATLAVAKYGPVSEKAYSAEAYSVLAQIVSAENSYRVEFNVYTSDITRLDIGSSTTTGTNLSTNFNYTVPSTNVSSGYAMANRAKTNKATKNYYMCLNGGKRSAGTVPGCP